jgi:hypothetical protein
MAKKFGEKDINAMMERKADEYLGAQQPTPSLGQILNKRGGGLNAGTRRETGRK